LIGSIPTTRKKVGRERGAVASAADVDGINRSLRSANQNQAIHGLSTTDAGKGDDLLAQILPRFS
jgi:hypothetical protein